MDGGVIVGLAKSRISAKGQVSIPVSVMRQFGLAPGEVITWDNLDQNPGGASPQIHPWG